MALQELIGFPFLICGPSTIENAAPDQADHYGWSGTDMPPTGAEWLCNLDAGAPLGIITSLILMDEPEPPDDLPEGWTAQAYEVDDAWSNDDGVWIVKAIHQKADGSWIFAGYCR